MEYLDRWGNKRFLSNNAMAIEKEAVYALVVCRGKVLITYPPFAIDVPELPGGGIEENEDIVTSLSRELYEETGVEYVLGNPEKTFEHLIGFFADDIKPNGEFWNYHQEFWWFELKDESGLMRTDRPKWKTPEGGYAEWIELDKLSKLKLFNEVHRIAVKELLSKS